MIATCRLLVLVVATLLSTLPSLAAANQKQTNILLVLIDDMGWPDLGCYGHAFHESPRIDRLAAEGVRFTDFYATPVCSSTRATIESGQNSARVGITDFLPGHYRPFARLVVPPMPDHLDPALTTPGAALSQAGYATGYFGKWHLGRGEGREPDAHGYQVTAKSLGKPFHQSRGDRDEGPKRMRLITDQALWFLEQRASDQQPFFLHVSHHAVHIPIQATSETIQKYLDKSKPDTGVNHPVYAAMIEDLDAEVGRLLDALEAFDLSQDTAVFVASDNGGLRKCYADVGQIVSTNAPLRSEKGTLYEGGIRVPLIVRWPAAVQAGSVCSEPAATWDLLPTFCSMAGVAAPSQPLDGVDLSPLLCDPAASLDREALYFHYPHYHHSRPARAVRHGDWKLIEWFENGAVEMYNLADDLGETNDLSALMPERAGRLQQQLADWSRRVGARLPTSNPRYDPEKSELWWDRRQNAPLNVRAFAERLENQASKPFVDDRAATSNK